MIIFNEYRCSNCGGKVVPSASNCPHCGVRLAGVKRSGFSDNRSFKQKFIGFSKGVLSLLVPGLGQLVNKQYIKAIFFFSVPAILWTASFIFYPNRPFGGGLTKFFLAAIIALIMRFGSAIDAGDSSGLINGGDLSLDDISLWKILYSLFLSLMIIAYFNLSYLWIILIFPLVCGIFIIGIPFVWDEIKWKIR